MANYVHNYLFCTEEAKNYILSDDAGYEISGRYDDLDFSLGDGSYLVTFDTRGMEYKKAFINMFIERYRDTVWHCIEENEAYEGSFIWNGTAVGFNERELVQEVGQNEMFIRYSDSEHRPFVSVFISDKEICIEQFLKNKVAKYKLHDDTSIRVGLFMNELIRDVLDHVEYAIPYVNSIEREILTHWNGKDYFIESYTEDDDWHLLVKNGETRFNHIIKFLEKILKYEGISNRIRFEEFGDFMI